MVHIIKAARGRITSEHGESIDRTRPHVGIDIGNGNMTDEDLLMVAPAAGRVTAAGWDGSYGNRVIISHKDGTRSLIAHMASLTVAVGDTVAQGDQIGVMGRTGGPWGSAGWYVHGHQEYHLATGAPANPIDYMGSNTAAENITPIIPEEDEDMASGIYTRIGKGQGEGSIFYQEQPGAPLYAMVGPEWAAASANGNKYSDIDATLVHELMRRVGVFKREAKYGRIVRDAAGQPIVDYPG